MKRLFIWLTICGSLISAICCFRGPLSAAFPIATYYASLLSQLGINYIVDEQFRYRLTVEIQTPDGIKAGTVVREINIESISLNFAGEKNVLSSSNETLHGEALSIDMGRQGILFFLFKSVGDFDYGSEIFFETFPGLPYHGYATPEGARHYASLNKKESLRTINLPMLVRFRDINDFRTLEIVDPDNLEAVFGEGVYVCAASIETTDAPVTRGISQYIGNLDVENWKLWASSLPPTNPLSTVSLEEFSRP